MNRRQILTGIAASVLPKPKVTVVARNLVPRSVMAQIGIAYIARATIAHASDLETRAVRQKVLN